MSGRPMALASYVLQLLLCVDISLHGAGDSALQTARKEGWESWGIHPLQAASAAQAGRMSPERVLEVEYVVRI
jgi:hypothetical protein